MIVTKATQVTVTGATIKLESPQEVSGLKAILRRVDTGTLTGANIQLLDSLRDQLAD